MGWKAKPFLKKEFRRPYPLTPAVKVTRVPNLSVGRLVPQKPHREDKK